MSTPNLPVSLRFSRRARALLLPFLTAALLCGSACSKKDDGGEETDGGAADLAAAPDQFFTCCGAPGDKGNSLQVGAYCEKFTDCFDNAKAKVCTVLGDPRTHFCTFACTQNGPAGQCGENAQCECQGANCACVPDACLMNTTPECKKN